ncbi:hypothetical protein COCCADRAFT_28293 [Bipolaris zeicola 26-R-13]|uniref:Uncharacterized protein n=1 Tax=Cochliobolus carbonum (strain 26-R-13) TaxID=930089 RepID=W6XYU9_COCC2|nr:uncharacterized protein COCCADRAFT_28293 [Bipolaris zeicola 26-R-13]EUC30913.1 hypothetical protein COCCADRAFT_28293 [Bipolaris zeicola 26-R-13]
MGNPEEQLLLCWRKRRRRGGCVSAATCTMSLSASTNLISGCASMGCASHVMRTQACSAASMRSLSAMRVSGTALERRAGCARHSPARFPRPTAVVPTRPGCSSASMAASASPHLLTCAA